ncbi:hypothetical protein INT44_008329 [Umbelopsis vinacea]|uniref:Transmembrane protein 188 n=1 Tax=Umbelopsis vinacea TaxID=44442 RepID=A0A8H7PVR6_9FUNG|nr:hypothetical protein INT44_008329 [Umbelopsis vinacea]
MVQDEAMPPSPDPVTQTLDTTSGPPPSADQVSKVTNRHMDTATYRDLVIFEERLRGNMRRLQRRKTKYEDLIISNLQQDMFVRRGDACFSVLLERHVSRESCLCSQVSGTWSVCAIETKKTNNALADRFVPHCNKALRSFNLHFNRDDNGQLSFYKKIPKQFQEGFNAYRQHYYVRKKARKAAKAAGGQRQPASLSNSSSKQQPGQKQTVATDSTKAKST